MTSYFKLQRNVQEELLLFGEDELSKPTKLLEKDIWLCWVLDVLFNIPGRKPMAFKGGTSLSKVFNAIHRFSEDVDITLDYKSFDVKIEGDLLSASKSKRKSISDELKKKVKEYSNDVIRPKLDASIKEISSEYTLDVDDSGEKITLSYPSALSNSKGINEYVKESILIELGGRNVIEPNNTHKVEPYLSQVLPNHEIELPSPDVLVLSPNRTFWEKATLIHVACNRGLKQNAERLSRHWYDLVKLYENSDGIGKDAIKNVGLLKDVVEHKMVFFNYSDAHYEYCLNKNFNLLPHGKVMEELKKDYEEMLDAKLIYDENYTFEYIISKIKEIQGELNCT